MASASQQPTNDNVEPSARESARIYGSDFARGLLVRAQLRAGEKNRKATRDDVQWAWRQQQRESTRPLWKELVAGGGWALIGAVAPTMIDAILNGTDIASSYVLIAFLGILLVVVGLYKPRS